MGICGGALLSSRKELFPPLFFRWEGGSPAAFPSSLAVFIGWGFGKKTRAGWSSWDRDGQHKGALSWAEMLYLPSLMAST